MKKLTLVLLALALFAVVPASFASNVSLDISFDGGATYTNICSGTGLCSGNFTGSGVSSGLSIASTSAFNNSPGGPLAISSSSSLNIAFTGGSSLSFLVRETSSAFTGPTDPFAFGVQESTTSPVGHFTFATTGALVGVPGCSYTTGTIDSIADAQTATGPCANSASPFSIVTTSAYTLQTGAQVNTTTTALAAAVPEPASMMLFGSGMLGLAGMIRRKLGK